MIRLESESEIRHDPSGFYRQNARRLTVGLLSASLALTACIRQTDDPIQRVDRNAPQSAEYFLDTDDPYFSRLAETLETTDDPTARENIERLMGTPISQWLNTTSEKTSQIIQENLSRSGANQSVPVFVAYNIPYRDLGGESGGGMANSDEYQSWIRTISESVGDSPAVLILEPDALAGIPIIEVESEQTERISMLRSAMLTFRDNNPNLAVYLDIGHSKWLNAGAVVDLMSQIDPDKEIIQGISVNVSNQRPELELRTYIEEISSKWGQQLYAMIDNSMNGASNTSDILEWCNPADERIGALVDTYFDDTEPIEQTFVKAPGESDGRCGTSQAPAGMFDSALLLNQVSSKK